MPGHSESKVLQSVSARELPAEGPGKVPKQELAEEDKVPKQELAEEEDLRNVEAVGIRGGSNEFGSFGTRGRTGGSS